MRVIKIPLSEHDIPQLIEPTFRELSIASLSLESLEAKEKLKSRYVRVVAPPAPQFVTPEPNAALTEELRRRTLNYPPVPQTTQPPPVPLAAPVVEQYSDDDDDEYVPPPKDFADTEEEDDGVVRRRDHTDEVVRRRETDDDDVVRRRETDDDVVRRRDHTDDDDVVRRRETDDDDVVRRRDHTDDDDDEERRREKRHRKRSSKKRPADNSSSSDESAAGDFHNPLGWREKKMRDVNVEIESKNMVLMDLARMRVYYPSESFPAYSDLTPLEDLIEIRNTLRRNRMFKDNFDKTRKILMTVWLAIEKLGTLYLSLDISGFAEEQKKNMDVYDQVVAEISERRYINFGSNFPPEVRIVFTIIMQVALFYFARNYNISPATLMQYGT